MLWCGLRKRKVPNALSPPPPVTTLFSWFRKWFRIDVANFDEHRVMREVTKSELRSDNGTFLLSVRRESVGVVCGFRWMPFDSRKVET